MLWSPEGETAAMDTCGSPVTCGLRSLTCAWMLDKDKHAHQVPSPAPRILSSVTVVTASPAAGRFAAAGRLATKDQLGTTWLF
jgi:hypothetical protein